MKKGTIIGCLAFTGPKGEDRKKIEKNWPFEEPKLNNMESHESDEERFLREQDEIYEANMRAIYFDYPNCAGYYELINNA